MKVGNVQPVKPVIPPEKVKPKEKDIKKKDVKEQPAAIYNKSEKKNIRHIYDKNTILKLKAETDKAYDSLRRIVEELLTRQGKTFKLLGPDTIVEVDEKARLEAQELIGPDGELGVEKTSQRIVDFAIAISGGDKSKLEDIKRAIDKGFKEAERVLGELPEISRQTYDAIMEKLDAWEKEE